MTDSSLHQVTNHKMQLIFGILALIGFASCSVQNWTEIRVKFGITSLGINTVDFFDVQSTLEEALAGDWTALDVPNLLNLQAVGYGQDYGFTPLYDSYGTLAGANIALPVDVLNATGPPNFDPTGPGTNVIITINGTEYYSSTFLFVDPATLTSGGRSSLTDGVVGEGLWIRNVSDSSGFTQIPDNLEDVVSETLFTYENCIPNMGIHYFYNQTVNSTSSCYDFNSWFLVGKDNSVIGIGYQIFGDVSKVRKERNWYDIITRLTTKLAIPISNDCMYDWADDYGVISLHVYFQPSPWEISCDQDTESVSPITLLNLPGTVISALFKSLFG